MEDLSQKKCVPCEGGLPAATLEQAEVLIKQIPKWQIDQSREYLQLIREFEFEDFKSALQFINSVGEIAETEGHHPNIYLYDYKYIKLELYTHAIGGLHENDFILASKIDHLA